MILFGSRARGDADPDSDMDVLVILDSPVDQPMRDIVTECAWEVSVGKGVVLVPVTVSKKEWEEGPESSSLLAIAVNRDGITV